MDEETARERRRTLVAATLLLCLSVAGAICLVALEVLGR